MKNNYEKNIRNMHPESERLFFTKLRFLMLIFSFAFICLWTSNVSAADWYKYGPVIHACGAYKGYNYTNSKEALVNTLRTRRNLRKLPIEIDFMFTSDGVPVCVHDWEHYNHSNGINSRRRMSLKEFKASHTKGRLTPMTAEEAIQLITKCRNTYLVIDTKETGVRMYKKLVKICKKTGHRAFLKRIIIQLYNFQDYKKIKKVYPFKHWLFSSYKVPCWTPREIKIIVKRVQKMKLDVLVMPYTVFAAKVNNHYKMKDRNIRAVNTNRRIPLITHTVNSRRLYNALRKNGVNGIYTDNIYKW